MTIHTASVPIVPPLQNGDRLSRDEFERRYQAMPSRIRAELIEGVVYMALPLKHPTHSHPHYELIGWLYSYSSRTPGIEGGDNGTIRLDLGNEPQPDAYLRVVAECGGQSIMDKDGYVEGAPEFVAEVAATSASYDLHDKLKAHRRNGVREYLVWRTLDRQIDWFVLKDGQYDRLEADAAGILKSRMFPGLWLHMEALLARDSATVVQVAQRGVETAAHDDYVKTLRSFKAT